jgi:hypothetical protein
MLVYLAKLLLFRIVSFFVHWYRDGVLFAYGKLLGAWRRIDRVSGLRVNALFLFRPLYQERNLTGYVLGFFVHLFRVVAGGVAALVAAAVITALLVFWLLIPVYLVMRIIQN